MAVGSIAQTGRRRQVGVVGAGLMSSQLALLFARQMLIPVTITDLDQERIDKGLAYVGAEVDKLRDELRAELGDAGDDPQIAVHGCLAEGVRRRAGHGLGEIELRGFPGPIDVVELVGTPQPASIMASRITMMRLSIDQSMMRAIMAVYPVRFQQGCPCAAGWPSGWPRSQSGTVRR